MSPADRPGDPGPLEPGRYRARVEGGWVVVPVGAMEGESLVVPVVAGLVSPDERLDRLLLQRRDKRDAVRGRWEIPMGRWRAGETPEAALAREVEEETGLRVQEVRVPARRHEAAPGRPFLALEPATVTIGVDGAYPALHLAFTCIAAGEPRPLPGETADPRWVGLGELATMLEDPAQFTGPALAILRTRLAELA